MSERPIDYGLTIVYAAMTEKQAWNKWKLIQETLERLDIASLEVTGWGPLMITRRHPAPERVGGEQ